MTETPPRRSTPSDVSRRAVEQATEVIGRLLQAFERPHDGDPLAVEDHPDNDGDDTFGQMRAAVGRAVDLYLDLFQRTFDVYVESTERALRRRGLSVAGSPGADVLVLAAADGEAVLRGALYLHNFTGEVAGPVTVTITDLTAHDGSIIRADDIDVEPRHVHRVDDRATVPVTVRVDIAAARAGTYHGHALVEGGSLALRVEVPRQ